MSTASSHEPHGAEGAKVAPVHVEHFHSWAPLLIGIGALFLYLGFEFVTWTVGGVDVPLFLPIGVIFFTWGVAQWAIEGREEYRKGHVDPGVLPGKHDIYWWGVLLFLGTEVMLFGGLFAVYFVARAANPSLWETSVGSLPLVDTAINTAILVASSFTYHFAESATKKGNRKGTTQWLVVTAILGIIFLIQQVREYIHLIAEGNVISKDAYWSIFYQLTGTHGAHVTLGIVLILIALWRNMTGTYDKERHATLTVFGMYWHFVDVVWVFLFLVIYVGVF